LGLKRCLPEDIMKNKDITDKIFQILGVMRNRTTQRKNEIIPDGGIEYI